MRKKPYTEIGIRRLKCFRCKKNKATQQWQTCADGNTFRGICDSCDIDLNEMVLKFFKFPDWKEKLNKYVQKLLKK